MTLAIGIMSGTSVDGIDAVLLDVIEGQSPRLLGTASRSIPDPMRERILSLMAPGANEIERAGSLDVALGEVFADIAIELVDRAAEACPDVPVEVIGCHGQTVRHCPGVTDPFTLQLGSGAVIATRTGIAAVTDFRSADMAVGGQGAPFAPFFHQHVFADDRRCRAIVNLGGIANITILPTDGSQAVVGFDSGPANGLMDLWVQRHLGKPFDDDGQWASQGQVNQGLLTAMLSEPYFSAPPPKSTGRELFNAPWLDRVLAEFSGPLDPADVQSTLAMLTARTVADQLPDTVDEIYLCGGGAENAYLRASIANASGLPVQDTQELGIPPRWIEAAAFAWLAVATLAKRRVTLPSVTGARRACVAGAVYYP